MQKLERAADRVAGSLLCRGCSLIRDRTCICCELRPLAGCRHCVTVAMHPAEIARASSTHKVLLAALPGAGPLAMAVVGLPPHDTMAHVRRHRCLGVKTPCTFNYTAGLGGSGSCLCGIRSRPVCAVPVTGCYANRNVLCLPFSSTGLLTDLFERWGLDWFRCSAWRVSTWWC
jgi:hypothetical protein